MDTQSASRDYRKMMFVFLTIVILGMGGIIGWEIYKEWTLPQRAAELQRDIERLQEEERQRLMEDTYGGKTPQETLGMYIEAVEKGDYELASKYFVEEKRRGELNSLERSSLDNISRVNKLLEQAVFEEDGYSWDRKEYGIIDPLSVRFILYPNGIWKIIEI